MKNPFRDWDSLDIVGVSIFGPIGVAIIGLLLFGLLFGVTSQMTGPCAFRGGVASYAQDYIYCSNGERRVLPHDDSSATSTLNVNVKNR